MEIQTEIRDTSEATILHFSDRGAQLVFRHSENVRGLVEILAPELAAGIDFNRLTRSNRDFLSDTLRQQVADLVYSVPFQSGSETEEILIYILLEHQSTVDDLMGFRVLFYMTQIWDEQRRQWEAENVPKSKRRFRAVLPIVFYTGNQRWNAPLSLAELMALPAELDRFVPAFETLFLSVKEASVSELTKTGHPLGWVLTVLQKERADEPVLRETLQTAVSHFTDLDAAHHRVLLRYLVLLILHRRPEKEHKGLINLVDRHAPEMEVETMAQSMAEVLLERGIEQGETRAKRDAVLNLLRIRFDSVPESITNEIAAIQSVSRLDLLFEKAVIAETLDEIQGDIQNSDALDL